MNGILDMEADRRRIYLLRHGHADYANDRAENGDVPLSGRGHQEAEAAAAALSIVRFDRALCSGLTRSKQTAEIVLERQTLTTTALTSDQRLEEIGVSFSETGLSLDQAVERVAESYRDAGKPGARMGGSGEPFSNAFARVVAALEDQLSQPGWATMLVVAHGGINRLILSWAVAAGVGAMAAFEQDTGCINILDIEMRGGAIDRILIRSANLTPYNMVKRGMVRSSLETAVQIRS